MMCRINVLLSLLAFSVQQAPADSSVDLVVRDESLKPKKQCPDGIGTTFVDWQADGAFKFLDRLVNTAAQPRVLNKAIDLVVQFGLLKDPIQIDKSFFVNSSLAQIKVDANVTISGLPDSITEMNFLNATSPCTLWTRIGFQHLNISAHAGLLAYLGFGPPMDFGTVDLDLFISQFAIEVELEVLMYKTDPSLAPQEWVDFKDCLGNMLKSVKFTGKITPILPPHSVQVPHLELLAGNKLNATGTAETLLNSLLSSQTKLPAIKNISDVNNLLNRFDGMDLGPLLSPLTAQLAPVFGNPIIAKFIANLTKCTAQPPPPSIDPSITIPADAKSFMDWSSDPGAEILAAMNNLLDPKGCLDLNHILDFALHEIGVNITTVGAGTTTPHSELFVGHIGPLALTIPVPKIGDITVNLTISDVVLSGLDSLTKFDVFLPNATTPAKSDVMPPPSPFPNDLSLTFADVASSELKLVVGKFQFNFTGGYDFYSPVGIGHGLREPGLVLELTDFFLFLRGLLAVSEDSGRKISLHQLLGEKPSQCLGNVVKLLAVTEAHAGLKLQTLELGEITVQEGQHMFQPLLRKAFAALNYAFAGLDEWGLEQGVTDRLLAQFVLPPVNKLIDKLLGHGQGEGQCDPLPGPKGPQWVSFTDGLVGGVVHMLSGVLADLPVNMLADCLLNEHPAVSRSPTPAPTPKKKRDDVSPPMDMGMGMALDGGSSDKSHGSSHGSNHGSSHGNSHGRDTRRTSQSASASPLEALSALRELEGSVQKLSRSINSVATAQLSDSLARVAAEAVGPLRSSGSDRNPQAPGRGLALDLVPLISRIARFNSSTLDSAKKRGGSVEGQVDRLEVTGLDSWGNSQLLRTGLAGEDEYTVANEVDIDGPIGIEMRVDLNYHGWSQGDEAWSSSDHIIDSREYLALNFTLSNVTLRADMRMKMDANALFNMPVLELANPQCLISAVDHGTSAAAGDCGLHLSFFRLDVGAINVSISSNMPELNISAGTTMLLENKLTFAFADALDRLINSPTVPPMPNTPNGTSSTAATRALARTNARAPARHYYSAPSSSRPPLLEDINHALFNLVKNSDGQCAGGPPPPSHKKKPEPYSALTVPQGLGLFIGIVFATMVLPLIALIHFRSNSAKAKAEAGARGAGVKEPLLEGEGSSDPACDLELRDTAPVWAWKCLAFHSRVTPLMCYVVPLVLVLDMLLFVYANVSIGASVVIKIQLGDEVLQLPPAFEFTLSNSVKDMWQAKVYALSLLIAVFSGAWPYLKLLLMLVAWATPTCVLHQRHRERVLMFLDAYGKWSLIDTYVLVMMMVAFRFHIANPIGDGALIPVTFLSIDVLVLPGWGFHGFLLATIVSLVMSHVIVGVHRHAASTRDIHHGGEKKPLRSHQFQFRLRDKGGSGGKPRDADDAGAAELQREISGGVSGLSEAATEAPGRVALFQCAPAGQTIVTMLLVAAEIIIVIGASADAFHFQFRGAAGKLLGPPDTDINLYPAAAYSRFSLLSLGQQLPDSTDDPNSFAIRWIQGVYFIFGFIVPVSHILTLLVLWLRPMTLWWQRAVFVMSEVLNAWNGLDVFVIAVLAALLEISQFAQFIIGGKCDLINVELSQYFSGWLDNDDRCFDVIAKLDSGCWLLFAASLMTFFTGGVVMECCHTALEERRKVEGEPRLAEFGCEGEQEFLALERKAAEETNKHSKCSTALTTLLVDTGRAIATCGLTHVEDV